MNKTIKQQLSAINRVMNKSQFPFYRFNFGRHKGKTLEFVHSNDEKYLHWLLSEDINDRLYKLIKEVLK